MRSTALRRAAMLLAALMLALGAGPDPAFAQRSDPKWYQVRPEYQGQPEYLYEIAERFLGDGDRFTEIFALNKGRVQVDGMALTDPQAIETGWILILPPDAKGEGVRTGPLPVVPSASAAAGLPSSAAQLSSAAPASSTASSEKGGGFPVALVALLAAAALIVAGAVFLLLRRRRTSVQHVAADPAATLTAAADWTIDRALRAVAASAEEAGRPAPPVVRVSLDDSRMRLLLTTPDFSPVDPWRVVGDGRTWSAPLPELKVLPAAGDTPSPYPLLVTLGTADGRRELIDLGRSGGVISVDGDAGAARELVAAWAEELVTSPWSSRVRVVTGSIVVPVRSGQLTVLDDIAAALDVADASDGELGVLMLGEIPDRSPRGWTVVVVGDSDRSAWHFTALSDGRLDAGALGVTVDRVKPHQGVGW